MAVAVMAGAVRVMLMLATVAVDTFPAMSVHVPVTDWFVPTLVTVTASGFVPLDVVVERLDATRVLTPEPASLQVNVTVTSWFVMVPGT